MDNYTTVNIKDLVGGMDNRSKFLFDVETKEYKLIENLIATRKKMNMTQLDIARITGMSQQAVSRIEKYGYKPSLSNLLKYMSALNLDINVIFN